MGAMDLLSLDSARVDLLAIGRALTLTRGDLLAQRARIEARVAELDRCRELLRRCRADLDRLRRDQADR